MQTGQVRIIDNYFELRHHKATSPVLFKNRKEAAENGLIELSIPAELIHYFSSNDYLELVSSGLSGPDAVATWVARYPGVIQSIFSNSSQMGAFIDFASEHWYVAFLFYLGLGFAFAVNLYHTYNDKKAVQQVKCDSYKQMHKLLCPQSKVKEKQEEKIVIPRSTPEQTIARLNKAFVEVINEDPGFRKKYKSINVRMPTEANVSELKLDVQFQTGPAVTGETAKPSKFKKFVNKFLEPLYTTISISSVAYWVFFISAAVASGNFADVGIAGVSAWLALSAPVAIAAPYVGLKIYNWNRNKGLEVSDEHARLTKIADSDSSELLSRAVRGMELDQEIERLNKEYNVLMHTVGVKTGVTYTPDQSVSNSPAAQASAMMYTTTVGRYVEAHFNAWIVGDFMKALPIAICAIPFFGEIAGSILMAIGVGFGLYEAHKKHKVAKESWSANQSASEESLLDIFNAKKAALTVALAELNPVAISSSTILSRALPMPPKPISTARKIWNFFEWKTTAIYFARVFFTVGAAIFLPFVAAAALSNPVTIGLLVLSGLIYVGVKMYQAHQKAKEEDAKALAAGIKKMDEQIHVAELTKRNQDAKKNVNEIELVSIPNKPPVALVHASRLFATHAIVAESKVTGTIATCPRMV